jgi:hypothetical protein
MKRLILILITGIFFCNISYGATIKELLGKKKELILNCTITKEDFIAEEFSKNLVGNSVGVSHTFKINFAEEIVNSTILGEPVPFHIFKEEIISFSDTNTRGDLTLSDTYSISRYTGTYEIMRLIKKKRKESDGYGFGAVNKYGTCEKVEGKIF